MSKHRPRVRRARLLPELDAGAPLTPHEVYVLPTGKWTRDQQLFLALWRLDAQGVRPWEMFAAPTEQSSL